MSGVKTGLGRVVKRERIRRARPMTLDQVASVAGIHRSTLAALESGAKENATVDVLRRIAKALGRPASEILRMVEDEEDLEVPPGRRGGARDSPRQRREENHLLMYRSVSKDDQDTTDVLLKHLWEKDRERMRQDGPVHNA